MRKRKRKKKRNRKRKRKKKKKKIRVVVSRKEWWSSWTTSEVIGLLKHFPMNLFSSSHHSSTQTISIISNDFCIYLIFYIILLLFSYFIIEI